MLGFLSLVCLRGFPGGSEVKASAWNAGDLGSIPGSGRSPGEGNGNPLQYSCLENPMEGEAWWATVHGVAKSRTRLSYLTLNYTDFLYPQIVNIYIRWAWSILLFQKVSEWVKSLSRVWLFATPWTVAYQASPSMGFSRQEHWSGLPFPSPGDLPYSGIEPRSPTLQAGSNSVLHHRIFLIGLKLFL